MTKERPILFSAPMVRAILDGSKTQTRRIMKQQPEPVPGEAGDFWWPCDKAQTMVRVSTTRLPGAEFLAGECCPYGKPGDRLWVRETCRAIEFEDGHDAVEYPADGGFIPIANAHEAAEKWLDLRAYGGIRKAGEQGRTVPAIHMPRWASRILLEIVSVRVERLREISEDDARSEGIREVRQWARGGGLPVFAHAEVDGIEDHTDPRDAYRALWNDINGAEAWDANPWVWVVEFKRVSP